MAGRLHSPSPRSALVAIARDFHARGWMWGTAGNLSVREDALHFWITASGLSKGRIDEDDFVLARATDGAVVEMARPGLKPSAETAVHAVIYQRFPEAGACLHGHTVAACRAASRAKKGARNLRLPPLEMVKGLGVWQQNPRVDLPLFDNHLDVARIAGEIDRRFAKSAPAIDALLIRAHGPTVWGRGTIEAYNRFECLEFLMQYAAGGSPR